MRNKIKFGTDGWRGLIGEDFSLANVKRIATAIALYLQAGGDAERGVVVGYDRRFLSPESAHLVGHTFAAHGIPVTLADACTPTPALSYAVVSHNAAAGVMITASHNPYRWNGVKVKAPFGGSAAPSMVKGIEEQLKGGRAATFKVGAGRGVIKHADLVGPYLAKLALLVDLKRIRASGFRFAIDPMYGAGSGLTARLFDAAGISYSEIHAQHNPLFPGLNPEPIEPHVDGLRKAVIAGGFAAGFATDGDADRVGAMDRSGSFIDSHKIFSILLKHLVEDRGKRGEVVRTFSTTGMIDKIARKHALPVRVTPIGFKYVCELMLACDVLIGGEESGGIGVQGHLPERDGILNSLLLAEVMAEKGRTLGELVEDLTSEFGPHFYGRRDLEIGRPAIDRTLRSVKDRKIKSVAGKDVLAVEDLDGFKMIFGDSTWLLVRASGTENLVRLYAEAPAPELVKKMLDEMVAMAQEERKSL
jgi:phosphomannomutase